MVATLATLTKSSGGGNSGNVNAYFPAFFHDAVHARHFTWLAIDAVCTAPHSNQEDSDADVCASPSGEVRRILMLMCAHRPVQ